MGTDRAWQRKVDELELRLARVQHRREYYSILCGMLCDALVFAQNNNDWSRWEALQFAMRESGQDATTLMELAYDQLEAIRAADA